MLIKLIIYLSVRNTIAFIYKIILECYKLNILYRKRPPGSHLLAKTNTVVFMEDLTKIQYNKRYIFLKKIIV